MTSMLGLSALVLLVVLSAACPRQTSQPQLGLPDPEPGNMLPPEGGALLHLRDSLRRELPRREAQWRAHAITDYKLTVTMRSYVPVPLVEVITVRGDLVSAHTATGEPLTADDPRSPIVTIPMLFEEIRRGIRDTTFTLSTRFHPTYGFPMRLNLQDRATGHIGYLAIVEAFEILSDTSLSKPRQNKP
jgi:hypothetical protein